MSGTNPVRELMNQQIDYTLSIIDDISAMFRNPTLDRDYLGITSETDFMMGAVWATCYDYFVIEFHKRYGRRPTHEENKEMILAIYERGREIRQTIQERLGL
jgi:hypothetical protein